ncbi:hypothetical protein [Cellulomonas sp. SLBN-39]|uniref:hypothetical protein n=1 Tax=Cellulomonas sp. SLBN-39 TaxID=2768446 RepID=UPI001151DC85|nr:hypothetical protein [Cellulomonas sp. SLBN-39]TQL01309.1 hypothetical protein FBY24_0357 [Cellulomonas sp. SLBN-39]
MSTVPGAEAWRDAGLVPVEPEQPVRLTDEPDVEALDAEEYRPGAARADRDGLAEEADVADQAAEEPLEEDDDQG